MLNKALDLLRVLGWGVINFIYSLIDSLFDIIKQLNSFNIIDSLAENSIFRNLHSSIIVISLTLFLASESIVASIVFSLKGILSNKLLGIEIIKNAIDNAIYNANQNQESEWKSLNSTNIIGMQTCKWNQF